MEKKKYQTVEVNGREMAFNLPIFQELFRYMANQAGKKIQVYEKILADQLFVNEATIHNWRQSRNCPGSLQLIQAIAEYWEIPVERLLTEVEKDSTVLKAEENTRTEAAEMEASEEEIITVMREEDAQMETTRKFTDREKDAVLRINDKFITYMEAFKKTGGFIASMNLPADEFGPVDEAYTKMQEDLLADLKHAVYREYIDLRDTVYNDLKYLVDNGVEGVILSEKWESGEYNPADGMIVLDSDIDEEEEEEILADLEEEDERFFLMLYVETIELFHSIVDPYL